MERAIRTTLLLVLTSGLAVACEAAGGVELEPLPPLERPSPEQRAGLPEVTGAWRFAGWEVASLAVGEALAATEAPGDLVLQSQRLDSVAGYFLRGDVRLPLVGEVRRDSVLSFASVEDAAPARFAAGRVSRDTLWLELSTLPFGELSLPTVRWAFVRTPVGQAFLRLPSGALLRDTVVALPPVAAADTAPPAAGAGLPEPASPPDTAAVAPRPVPREEPAAAPTQPVTPRADPRPDSLRAPRVQEPPPERPRRPAQDTLPTADTIRPLRAPGPDVDIPRRD